LPRAHAQSLPKIFPNPKNMFATPGETFNVSIMCSTVHSLYTYQVYFNFSKEILEVTNVTKGKFLSRGGAYDTFWYVRIQNDKGRIMAWESLLLPDPAVDGSGEFFKVTFRVKKAGYCEMPISNTQLVNDFADEIRHDAEGGTFTTTKLSITPNVIRDPEYVPGASFDVNVTLDGAVENLYGFNMTITYDNKILNATSTTLVPLLATPNTNVTEIDFNRGTVWLNVTSITPAASTNNTGAIATITFEILTVGNTDIKITKTQLINKQAESIFHIIGKASFSGVLRNIGITEVTLSPLVVTTGENVLASITVQNDGSLNETFYVRVYARQNSINAIVGSSSEFTVGILSNITIPMNLSTNGLEGNYTIFVFVSYVPDETNLEDNEYVYPTTITVNPKKEGLSVPLEIIYVVIAVVLIIVAVAVYYKLKGRSKTS